MSIYVEILVRAPMDTLWSHTQTPALHERWDLRFSRIEYLPRNDESEPQRFSTQRGSVSVSKSAAKARPLGGAIQPTEAPRPR